VGPRVGLELWRKEKCRVYNNIQINLNSSVDIVTGVKRTRRYLTQGLRIREAIPPLPHTYSCYSANVSVRAT
jgi:hypothetical protein